MGESRDDTAAGAGGMISGSETCGCKRCDKFKELVEEEGGDNAVGGGRGRAQVGGGPAGVTRSGISSAGPACGRGGRAGYVDDDGNDSGERAVRTRPFSLELVLRRSATVSAMVEGLFGAPNRILDCAAVVARRSCRGANFLVVGALAGAQGNDIVVV
ncbi:hypothetical protein PG985_008660 [Apiospora marii]|uniref:uncharacterized protein n=1 Tax=Apiospora marii TaxID=335849 RepID=UPI00312D96CB